MVWFVVKTYAARELRVVLHALVEGLLVSPARATLVLRHPHSARGKLLALVSSSSSSRRSGLLVRTSNGVAKTKNTVGNCVTDHATSSSSSHVAHEAANTTARGDGCRSNGSGGLSCRSRGGRSTILRSRRSSLLTSARG